jgi:type I restriction enzyme M protein
MAPGTSEDLGFSWIGDPRSRQIVLCESVMTAEIAEHGYVLTPGRYVGAEAVEDDDEPFDDKMKRLTATPYDQFAESRKLEKAIRTNLEGLGYSG